MALAQYFSIAEAIHAYFISLLGVLLCLDNQYSHCGNTDTSLVKMGIPTIEKANMLLQRYF